MSAISTPPGPEHEHVGDAADVKDADVAHKEVPDHSVEGAPQHVHRGRGLPLAEGSRRRYPINLSGLRAFEAIACHQNSLCL
jgi:hypothetical protein